VVEHSISADPVMSGFTTAAAFLIGDSQVKKLFQVHIEGDVRPRSRVVFTTPCPNTSAYFALM